MNHIEYLDKQIQACEAELIKKLILCETISTHNSYQGNQCTLSYLNCFEIGTDMNQFELIKQLINWAGLSPAK